MKELIKKYLIDKLGIENSTSLQVCLFYYYQHIMGKIEGGIRKLL